MSSPLLPSTQAALRGVRPSSPLFRNMVMAEEFDRAYTRGRFKVLPRTDGRFGILEVGAPPRTGPSGSWATAQEAFDEVVRLADLDAAEGCLEAAE